MPTIQVRIDDQTKTASTALFSRLGITMSDAINLFLRQSIMRGGIPFSLTLQDSYESGTGILDNEAFIDAIRRYKLIYGDIDFDISKAEPIIKAIDSLETYKNMRITLQEKAVKVKLNYKDKDFVLDYNFDEPDCVFVLTRKNGKLFVKDSKPDEIPVILEQF